MGGDSTLDVGEVPIGAPDDANMLGSSDKLYRETINLDEGDSFLVINKWFMFSGRKCH